jgi:hypothetical protein
VRDTPEVCDGLAQPLFGGLQLGWAATRLRADQPEREEQGNEALLRAVVQVTFDPASFGIAGSSDAAS